MINRTTLVLLLVLLIAPLSGPRSARAEYFHQFGYLSVTDGGNHGGEVGFVDTIDRYASEFLFAFYDRLDPATIAPSVTVTGPDGTPQTWALDAPPGASWFFLRPPGVLEPEATYTLEVKGGPDGLLNGDGAPMASDLRFELTTEADTPFRLETVSQNSPDGPPILNEGSVLPRNATHIQLRFSHPVNPESARALIRALGDDGQDAGWQMNIEARSIYLTWPERLPRGELDYFISVPQAVQDVAGQPLAEAPLTLGIRTLDRAYRFDYQWQTTWDRHQVLQNESWRFYAAPGELRLFLFWDFAPAVVRMVVIEEATDQPVWGRYLLVRGESRPIINLPRAGVYRLEISPNRLGRISASGMDLDLEPVLPALAWPNLAPFAVVNEPFTFEPVVQNPEVAAGVGIYQNDVPLFEGSTAADGTIGPVTVATDEMPDGLFYLTTIGVAPETGSYALRSVPLLVDRNASFPDVPVWHWARPYIEALHDDGIVGGRPGGDYAPADPVTRAEFAKMLSLTLGLEPDPATTNPFADVPPGHWAERYILALWEYGLIAGEVVEGQRYFHPNRTISRAEAATILGRTLGLSLVPPEGRPFTDWDEVPDWARGSVIALSTMGWVGGMPDGTFRPNGQLQRDQTAKLLAQFYLP
ncbi:MAG TPA: S-layer homology domain-containing protein [Symbiobacteriaceae bacterium]|nr:S-layer homology domain-containing protein [Symbiobacteriaceae bacterium]